MFRLMLVKFSLISLCIASSYEERTVYTQALLTLKHDTSDTSIEGKMQWPANGKYAEKSPKKSAKGIIYYPGDSHNWCKNLVKRPKGTDPWIALIPSGQNSSCSDNQKIKIAKESNATAVIMFDDKNYIEIPVIQGPVYSLVTVMISYKDGREIINVKTSVSCDILVGTHFVDRRWKVSRTSVLFVLISFILLMCISLAWLVFYYVQRFRHIYKDDRKKKQLLTAANKAISKLKTRNVQFISNTNKGEVDDSCAICLENYKESETLRVLPCKHEFHKGCIDPWLLHHRTCPMCKNNILKSLGVDLPEPRSGSILHERSDIVMDPQIQQDLRRAGLTGVDNNPIPVIVVTNGPNRAWTNIEQPEHRYSSSSSSSSDTDSDRSTIALVSDGV